MSDSLAATLGIKTASHFAPGTAGMTKLVVFVPPEHTDRVRQAAGDAGAGIIGEYSQCSFASPGTGTFMPSAKAHPYDGSAGNLSRSAESRLEMVVPTPFAGNIVAAAKAAHPYEEMAYDLVPLANACTMFGYGAAGDMEHPMQSDLFADHVCRKLGVDCIRGSRGTNEPVRRAAVMGGAGGRYIGDAIESGADAYVTGDLGYHDFLSFGDDILLIDATHRATELPVLASIRDRLAASLPGTPIEITVVQGIDTSAATYRPLQDR